MTDFVGFKRVEESQVLSIVTYIYWRFQHPEGKSIPRPPPSPLSNNFTLNITASRGCENKTFSKGHKEKCVRNEFVPLRLNPFFCSKLNHCSMRAVCFSHYIRFMVSRPSLSVHAADNIQMTLLTKPWFSLLFPSVHTADKAQLIQMSLLWLFCWKNVWRKTVTTDYAFY